MANRRRHTDQNEHRKSQNNRNHRHWNNNQHSRFIALRTNIMWCKFCHAFFYKLLYKNSETSEYCPLHQVTAGKPKSQTQHVGHSAPNNDRFRTEHIWHVQMAILSRLPIPSHKGRENLHSLVAVQMNNANVNVEWRTFGRRHLKPLVEETRA